VKEVGGNFQWCQTTKNQQGMGNEVIKKRKHGGGGIKEEGFKLGQKKKK